jgi:hypothetical protein
MGGGAAWAADVAIAAIYGRWQGTAMSESELSVYFQLTSRDLDVLIAPEGKGFYINWTTIQRQRGDVAKPRAVNKSTKMSFVPTDKPNVWRATGASDPLVGPYAWARLKDNTLTVHSLEVQPDGGFELQVYARTLADTGMTLAFSRSKNGERIRTAKGRLIKVADQ